MERFEDSQPLSAFLFGGEIIPSKVTRYKLIIPASTILY